MNDNLPAKKDVALALLERSSVFVHLDPRARGVVVPQSFKKEAQLVLQIGLNMAVQIPDLRLDDDGMSCTLSFSRSPFFCVLPWAAVFAMVGEDGRGMVWPNDVPPEIQQSVNQSERRAAPAPKAAEPAKGARLAIAPAPAATNGKAAARRTKRKDERPRPQLVAVPRDAEASAGAAPEIAPRARKPAAKNGRDGAAKGAARKQDGASIRARDVAAGEDAPIEQPPPRPRPAPRVQASKPRRELPPYLRVVK